MRYWAKNLSLLLGTLIFIFLIDRILLSTFGLPFWKPDPVLHYKHRPGNTGNWGSRYGNKSIYINKHGFHDDDFPEKKSDSELRGLIIGDSIVMGHGVTAAETFANQLERMLPDSLPGFDSFQVINAGVQGYSTFQYLEVFRRSIKFNPDFVVIGFCMNDVTEPYLVNKSYGGSGIDYHGVLQITQPIVAYLVNETGFGRLAIHIRKIIKRKRSSIERLARREIYNIRKMAKNSRTDPLYIVAWEKVLLDLSRIYALADSKNLPIVLVIFPHRFQLGRSELQEPQRILREHADLNGVSSLDMTEVLEKLIVKGIPITDLLLDRDHYTVEGHRAVAEALLNDLKTNGIF